MNETNINAMERQLDKKMNIIIAGTERRMYYNISLLPITMFVLYWIIVRTSIR